MKILMLAFNQVHQGTYWRAFCLARELVRRGHQVTLMATSKQNRGKCITREEEGVELVETPDLFSGALRSGWDPWNTLRRIAWLRGRKFDLVHAFESRPTVIFPALYIHNQGVPLVMDWADWFGKGGSVEERPNPIVRALLRPVETFFENHYRTRAVRTTVICSALYEKAIQLGVPDETILRLPNGADINSRELYPVAEARLAVGLPPNEPVIGYVGTIFPKDAQLMVDAFEIVLRHLPSARLVIAGYCRYDVRSGVSRPENVIQTGFLDNRTLNQYLSSCDLFWLPLRDSNANRGRFPYKLTDYMALNRPVVATTVGDIPEILNNEGIGLLSPDSAQPFAECTLQLLANPGQREEMGRKARKLAETRFSWKEISVELETLYQAALTHMPDSESKRI
jgi:glycosyltransferase involved in cell wall biosynthesis